MYLFFLRVELGCFSFIPNEATSSARFYEDVFPLDHTCFTPTSHFSYCMSRVLRRKSLTLVVPWAIIICTAYAWKLWSLLYYSFESQVLVLFVCSFWSYTKAGKINCVLCFKLYASHCFLFICIMEDSGLKPTEPECSDINKL